VRGSHSGEPPSPRRGLEKGEQWLPAPSRLGEPSSLERECGSLKGKRVALATPRAEKSK